jgi:acetolactate synthase I/II/III large subunit
MVRFNLPFGGIVGDNSAWNQIRFGQIAKYGRQRGEVGNKWGDRAFDQFASMLGGGGEVRDPHDTQPV